MTEEDFINLVKNNSKYKDIKKLLLQQGINFTQKQIKILEKHFNIKKRDNIHFRQEYKKQQIIEGFQTYQNTNKIYKSFDWRGINLPSEISEGLVAILLNGSRNDVIKGADLVINNEQCEIKGCSIKKDCTSFSPKQSSTSVYFVYINPNSGEYILYDKFSINKLYPIIISQGKHKNRKQSTFKEQMDMGRRPRLCINDFIIENNIPILLSGNIINL